MPWLGKIPEHWVEKRAKYFFREVDERSTDGEEELLSVSHLTGVTPRSQKNVTMFLAESTVGHKLCQPGDLVVNTMWAWMAALGVAKQAGLVSPSYGVYRPRWPAVFLSELVDELLRTPPYISEYICRSTGITTSRLRLYPEQFLRIPFACPPLQEQRLIMRFVAAMDRRVRLYIRAKQKLIKLLEEQKQVIINRAVTRGLDPNVRLKHSSVEWLGDVPEHWEVRKLGTLGFFYKGRGIAKVDITETGVPAITYGDIYTRYGVEVKALSKCTSPEVAANAQEILRGDLLFTASGETIEEIGKTTLYSGDVPAYAGGDIIILRLEEGDGLYLSYALNSNLGIRQKSAFGRGDIIVHICDEAEADCRAHSSSRRTDSGRAIP